MGKMFGILVIIFGVWVGGEVYTKGAANAFGGLLANIGIAEAEPDATEPQSAGRRTGSKVIKSHAAAEERRDRMLEE